MFVSSLLVQGGVLSFENAQGVLKYFKKRWLESMTRFHPLTQSISEGKVALLRKQNALSLMLQL